MEQGVLDLLDRADVVLDEAMSELDAIRTDDRACKRKSSVRMQNARLIIQEVRRRLERAGQETST